MVLLMVLAAFLFVPVGTAAEKCSVSGIVVNAVTGDPLTKVELLLEPLDRQASHAAGTTSDSSGHFAFVDLDPGSYRLKGQRNGYLETFYGARRPDSTGTVLKLAQGQVEKDLKLKLLPVGAIAGTVWNGDGEPLVDAVVTISTLGYQGGRRYMDGVDSTETDDLGQYRFHNLEPGKYYIVARSRSGESKVDHSADPKTTHESAVPTFYPGVQDARLAAPVELAAGARLTGIDITLLPTRGFRVSGRVVDATGGVAADIVIMDGVGGLDGSGFQLRASTRNAAGDFDLRGVPPGSYVLHAADRDRRVGNVPVEVGEADVDGVRVVLGRGVEVKGRISTEGDKKLKPAVVEVFLMNGVRSGQSGKVAQDSSFIVRNVFPGKYIVRLHGGKYEEDFYIRSIRSGDADVFQDGLAVTESGVPPLEIMLCSDGGTLEGVVSDNDHQVAAGAIVVLVPDIARRARDDLFKDAITDQYGHYQFKAVAPGDYKLFTWGDVEPGAWQDPDFLKDFEDKGEPVSVRATGRQTVSVRLIRDRPQ